PFIWLTTSRESLRTCNRFAPSLRATSNPAIRASYSASLFVALNSHHTEYTKFPPCDDFKTIPRPHPRTFDEPSTWSVQGLSEIITLLTSSYVVGSSSGENSATKSANACDFIAVLGLNSMSNPLR